MNTRIPHQNKVRVNYCLKSVVSIVLNFQLCSTCYVHSISIKINIKKHLCDQSSYNEKHGWFLLCKGSRYVLQSNRYFCCQWNTKKGNGKSTNNALYISWYAKMHLSAEAMPSSEKLIRTLSPSSLSSYACLKGISQSVENSNW